MTPTGPTPRPYSQLPWSAGFMGVFDAIGQPVAEVEDSLQDTHFIVYAVNHIEQAEADLATALRLLGEAWESRHNEWALPREWLDRYLALRDAHPALQGEVEG